MKKEIIQLSGQIIGAAMDVLNESKPEHLQMEAGWCGRSKQNRMFLIFMARNSYLRYLRNPRF
jgi:hypothetical protein